MEFVPARRLCANHGPNGLGLHDLSFKRITHHAANGFAAGGVTLQSESRRHVDIGKGMRQRFSNHRPALSAFSSALLLPKLERRPTPAVPTLVSPKFACSLIPRTHRRAQVRLP